MEVQRLKTLEAIKDPGVYYYYGVNQDRFGCRYAYSLLGRRKRNRGLFRGSAGRQLSEPKVGLQTGDNDRF